MVFSTHKETFMSTKEAETTLSRRTAPEATLTLEFAERVNKVGATLGDDLSLPDLFYSLDTVLKILF